MRKGNERRDRLEDALGEIAGVLVETRIAGAHVEHNRAVGPEAQRSLRVCLGNITQAAITARKILSVLREEAENVAAS